MFTSGTARSLPGHEPADLQSHLPKTSFSCAGRLRSVRRACRRRLASGTGTPFRAAPQGALSTTRRRVPRAAAPARTSPAVRAFPGTQPRTRRINSCDGSALSRSSTHLLCPHPTFRRVVVRPAAAASSTHRHGVIQRLVEPARDQNREAVWAAPRVKARAVLPAPECGRPSVPPRVTARQPRATSLATAAVQVMHERRRRSAERSQRLRCLARIFRYRRKCSRMPHWNRGRLENLRDSSLRKPKQSFGASTVAEDHHCFS